MFMRKRGIDESESAKLEDAGSQELKKGIKERKKKEEKKKGEWDNALQWLEGKETKYGTQTKREKQGKEIPRENERNKAGYTAQDAPSMSTFHLQK